MTPHRRKSYPWLVLPVLVAAVFIYTAGCTWYAEWECGWTREHRAFRIAAATTGIQLRIGWGWPFRSWIIYKEFDGWNEIGHECLGFLLGSRSAHFGGYPGMIVHWILIGIPWWFPLALFVAPSLDRLERRRRATVLLKRRQRRTLCPGCGYDLGASHDRCPECGQTITLTLTR